MIARTVHWAHAAASSPTSIVLLVAFNAVPLAGVLFLGWNIATILVLYWLENGIVGLLNVPKILLAEGPIGGRRPGPFGTAVTSVSGPTSRIGQAAFFLVHYGIFWTVHGIFVFALPRFAAFGSGSALDPAFGAVIPLGSGTNLQGIAGLRSVGPPGPDMAAVAVGAIGLAISRVASFVVNYLGRREYLGVSPLQQMFAPYGRLVILHVTIIIGAIVSMLIGSPVGAIALLVVLKTIVDLALHVREHDGLARRRASSTTPVPRRDRADPMPTRDGRSPV